MRDDVRKEEQKSLDAEAELGQMRQRLVQEQRLRTAERAEAETAQEVRTPKMCTAHRINSVSYIPV